MACTIRMPPFSAGQLSRFCHLLLKFWLTSTCHSTIRGLGGSIFASIHNQNFVFQAFCFVASWQWQWQMGSFLICVIRGTIDDN